MAYDPASGETILYAGQTSAYHWKNDMWSWNGERWREIHLPDFPHAEKGIIAWDYDEGNNVKLFFRWR